MVVLVSFVFELSLILVTVLVDRYYHFVFDLVKKSSSGSRRKRRSRGTVM